MSTAMQKLRNERRKKGWCVQCGHVLSDEEREVGNRNCSGCRKKARETGRGYRRRLREKLTSSNPDLPPQLARVKLPPGPHFPRATNPAMGHIRWGRLKKYLLEKLQKAKGRDPEIQKMLAIMASIERGVEPDEAVR